MFKKKKTLLTSINKRSAYSLSYIEEKKIKITSVPIGEIVLLQNIVDVILVAIDFAPIIVKLLNIRAISCCTLYRKFDVCFETTDARIVGDKFCQILFILCTYDYGLFGL